MSVKKCPALFAKARDIGGSAKRRRRPQAGMPGRPPACRRLITGRARPSRPARRSLRPARARVYVRSGSIPQDRVWARVRDFTAAELATRRLPRADRGRTSGRTRSVCVRISPCAMGRSHSRQKKAFSASRTFEMLLPHISTGYRRWAVENYVATLRRRRSPTVEKNFLEWWRTSTCATERRERNSSTESEPAC